MRVFNASWFARHILPAAPMNKKISVNSITTLFLMAGIGISTLSFGIQDVEAQIGLQRPLQSRVTQSAPNLEPQDDLQSLEQQLKAREEEEERLRQEAEEHKQEIQALRYQMIETANSIQDSEREIARIEREIERLTAEEKQAAGELAKEEGNLSEVLAALQAFELSRPPALVVSPEDANRAARAAMLLSDAAPALAAKAESLRALMERLANARTGLADQQLAYEKTTISLMARRQVLVELLAQKETERDVAERLAAVAQQETAALASQATSLKEVVARLQRLAHGNALERPKMA